MKQPSLAVNLKFKIPFFTVQTATSNGIPLEEDKSDDLMDQGSNPPLPESLHPSQMVDEDMQEMMNTPPPDILDLSEIQTQVLGDSQNDDDTQNVSTSN